MFGSSVQYKQKEEDSQEIKGVFVVKESKRRCLPYYFVKPFLLQAYFVMCIHAHVHVAVFPFLSWNSLSANS